MQDTNDTKPTEAETTAHSSVTEVTSTQPKKSSRGITRYVAVAGIVILMAGALLYTLERQGRVSTGLFGDVVGGQAVAYVNGEKIARRDYEASANQLLDMAAAQGVDVTVESTATEYRTQALDTLINGELLRQAAIGAGKTASLEAIDERYGQIATDLGGEEILQERMAEFGITEAVLRRDIENEILIQGLFDERFPLEGYEVSDEEVQALYDQISEGNDTVPPLEEIAAEIANQIQRNEQQQAVSNLIDELRVAATIELLL
jgi:hypothetical protein